jgi:solute carrier family 25, member 34/35
MLEGSVAACIAVTMTNPFEVIKIKRQLAEELTSTRSHFSLNKLIKNDGFLSLQRGLLAAYTYQAVMNGLRFSLYPYLKENTGSFVLAGAISGGVSAFVASPLNLLKTRQQSYSPYLASLGVIRAQHPPVPLYISLRELYRAGGIRTLWHGAPSASIRSSVGSSVQLASYDVFKVGAGDDASWALKIVGAMFSGALTAAAMNPFDVIMTRMYNNDTLLYKSWWQCFSKMIKFEGPLALWRGLPAHYLRIGPHTALTLLIVDYLNADSKNKNG